MLYKFVKHKNLTKAVNKIFNGLVKNVYILKEDCHSEAEENKCQYKQRVKYFDKQCTDTQNASYISHDGEDIIVEFTNGSVVKFSNSEWGGFGNIDKECDVLLD